MNPHASLKEPNLREREMDVSSGFGFHFGRVWKTADRSVGVNWTVLAEDMIPMLVVKSRRRMAPCRSAVGCHSHTVSMQPLISIRKFRIIHRANWVYNIKVPMQSLNISVSVCNDLLTFM
jgi:hypothetical protein